MKPVPRSVNLALAGLFKHPLKEVTAFLSAEGLGVSTPVPRGVRHRWPLPPQGQLFKFAPEPLLFGTFSRELSAYLAGWIPSSVVSRTPEKAVSARKVDNHAAWRRVCRAFPQTVQQTPCIWGGCMKKKIRAAHAKERSEIIAREPESP